RHGILVFDEIFLRESLSVNTNKLTYIGFEDLGDGITSERYGEKADHGLVFLFRSLASSYSQPIAMFASKGPIPGKILAQLILKSIALLENIGAKVDGIVSDGASSNRKVWKEFGVSGEFENVKNYFTHPLDKNRNIFMFSDAPHLMKTIRNRIHNKKYLKVSPDKKCISWFHFVEVFNRDSINILRVCPKITKRHLFLDNLAKMSVKLATQVLSQSMADGIKFYRENQCEGLGGSEETEEFT
ncbi:THAP-type domain-containing protein, partial [Aphis craccivora]